MDSWWNSEDPKSVFAREHCAQEKAANIEKVFVAISNRASTALDISDSSGLSLATTQKALHELEDWPESPRIIRTRCGRAHRFEVVK